MASNFIVKAIVVIIVVVVMETGGNGASAWSTRQEAGTIPPSRMRTTRFRV